MTQDQITAQGLADLESSSPLFDALVANSSSRTIAPPPRTAESAVAVPTEVDPPKPGPRDTSASSAAAPNTALPAKAPTLATGGGPWQYPLDLGSAIVVRRDPGNATYRCSPLRTFAAATPAWGLSKGDLDAARSMARFQPGQSDQSNGLAGVPDEIDETGLAQAFVDLLRHEVVPPVAPFRVLRLVPPPEALGERPIIEEGASSVVVGERVVVTWVRDIVDGPHVVPQTLAHLDAVNFMAAQEVYGVLLWTTPTGREVPVAWAHRYLPRARDGWDWCLDLTQTALGLTPTPARPRDTWSTDFASRLGRFTAKLHLALATASPVLPQPVITAPGDLVRAWHRVALDHLNVAAAIAESGELTGAQEVLLPRLEPLRQAMDRLVTVAARIDAGGRPVTTHRIHGDLHVGQLLRWSGGLVVVDFHPNPVIEVDGIAVGQVMQPAARDLARLLRSLDHVGRVVDKTTDFALTELVDAWSLAARTELLTAYRDELASAGREELFDEDLVAAFEAEQLCREVAYAYEHLPSWVYAPLGGVWQSYPAVDHNPSPARHA